MDNSKNSAKIIGSLVIGALAGATLGVLFAPSKGSKTRSKITGRAEKLSKGLKKKMSKEAKFLKNEAVKLENFVENKIESVTASLKDKANTLLHSNSDHEFNKK